MWVLKYVNGQSYVGRFDGRWTEAGLDGAAVFHSEAEAHNARQSLRQAAKERISQPPHADEYWWNWYGGVITVVEVMLVEREKV